MDAGYKVIVVLAGVHKSLRSQTQLRLDEGFLGRDSQNQRAYEEGIPQIGAGKIPTTKKLIVHSVTSSADKGDFNKKVANQLGVLPGGAPILLVVKKNKSILENLVRWTSTTGGHSGKQVVPLLIVDDEADHSSINTKLSLDENGREADENEATTINQLIRKLLKSFDQSAYVGYTATPFANIFIYPSSKSDKYGDDLFPRNFIVNLPAPTNYVCPAQLFGMEADKEVDLEEVEGLDIIRGANDQKEWMPVRHKKDHKPPYLPASLKEALRAFILTCAARIARGQDGVHNSMLIHVTRYTNVQQKVTILVKDELKHIEKQLPSGEGNPPSQVVSELEKLWREDFIPTTESVKNQHPSNQVFAPVTWDEVRDQLYPAASRIQVKEINGSAKDALEYYENKKNGLSVIAIGGDKLSRGLTLEGLSVSYFLRASRMYDTLMQMGRWFGYRPGYLDLCRLYTSGELINSFRDITAASEELRLEFDNMAAIGETPEKYGLKVRTHPLLMITAAKKMKTGTEIELSFAGSLSETTVFSKEEEVNKENLEATETLLGSFENPKDRDPTGNYIWKDIPGDKILDFLAEYQAHEKNRRADTNLLSNYIKAQLPQGDLKSWTVVLISKKKAKTNKIAGYEVGLTQRKDVSQDPTEYRPPKSRILSPLDEWIDFSESLRQKILKETNKEREKKGKTPSKTPSGPILRAERPPSEGLMLLYPLDYSQVQNIQFQFPVVGFVISFPGSKTAKVITYKVNNPYWEQEFGEI